MAGFLSAVAWNTLLATSLAGLLLLLTRLHVLQVRPSLRHALWLLVLARFVTPPLIPLGFLPAGSNQATADKRDSANELTVESRLDDAKETIPSGSRVVERRRSPADGQTAGRISATRAESLAQRAGALTDRIARWTDLTLILLIISASGTCVLVVLAFHRARQAGRLLAVAEDGNEILFGAAARAADSLGHRRPLLIRVINANIMPMLWISRRGPMIVLPKQWIAGVDPDQLQCVLRHEIAHFVRRDHWANTFAFAVAAIFWWHPVVWVARRELRAAQEICCDVLVLAGGHINRRKYAETLLLAVDSIGSTRPLLPELANGFGTASSLQRRLEMLGHTEFNPRLSRLARLSLLALATLLPCLPTRGEGPGEQQTPPAKEAARSTADKPTSTKPDDTEKQMLWRRAMDSIAKNYAEIKSVQGTLEELSIDPNVEQRKTTTIQHGDGTITFTQAPVFISREVFIIKGNDLRSDGFGRIKNEWTLGGKTSRRGDVWTFFHPQEPWAQIKRTADIGSMGPIDPRQFGGLDEQHGLLDQMSRSRPVEVLSHGPKLRIRTEIVDSPKYGYRKGQQHCYVLDPAMNYLPTEVVRYCDDGTINVVTELSYDEVIPHKAWFMRDVTRKIFRAENKVHDTSSDQWGSMSTYRIVGVLRINEEVKDDAFNIDFPPATRVVDQVD